MPYYNAVDRVRNEFRDFARYTDTSIKIELAGEVWTELRGMLTGPINTPYEGGTFLIDINVPEYYPYGPPNVRFVTKVWHPNISSVTGAVCMDILKNEWVSDLTLRNVLLSLQGLLYSPEPNDPQDAVVARQALIWPTMFLQTARHWTNVYADGPVGLCEYDYKVKLFKEMGFQEHASRVALSSNFWDVVKATDYLTE